MRKTSIFSRRVRLSIVVGWSVGLDLVAWEGGWFCLGCNDVCKGRMVDMMLGESTGLYK